MQPHHPLRASQGREEEREVLDIRKHVFINRMVKHWKQCLGKVVDATGLPVHKRR